MSHMAKANPQWQQLESTGQPLVIFQGPHAYISPTLYESEFAVPTWNYAAVHVYGVPRIITEAVELQSMLEKLVSIYESGRHPPWSVSWEDERYKDRLNSIVGFEIEITRIEGKFKLSQNRPPADQLSVIEGLKASHSQVEREVGELMRDIAGSHDE